eukprot:1001295_1
MIMDLLFFCLCYLPLLKAFESVTSISVYVSDENTAESDSPNVYVTLWYDTAVYQFDINSPERDRVYTYNGQSNCNTPTSNTKVMIENDWDDAIIFDWIQFTTSSGTWYGIDAKCIDSITAEDYYYSAEWNHWLLPLDPSECSSRYASLHFCIDNDPTDCGPSKQIFFFDTSRPNQSITNPEYVSGVNIVVTCPTSPPTPIPTSPPTSKPTHQPTPTPTVNPTAKPTKIPTHNPTIMPTNSPSKMPSNFPTDMPFFWTSYSATTSQVTITEFLREQESITTQSTEEHLILYISSGCILFIIICLIGIICIVIKRNKSVVVIKMSNSLEHAQTNDDKQKQVPQATSNGLMHSKLNNRNAEILMTEIQNVHHRITLQEAAFSKYNVEQAHVEGVYHSNHAVVHDREGGVDEQLLDDEHAIIGVTLGGDAQEDEPNDVISGINIGEGAHHATPPPNNPRIGNAQDFVHSAVEDEIILGDDETHGNAESKIMFKNIVQISLDIAVLAPNFLF